MKKRTATLFLFFVLVAGIAFPSQLTWSPLPPLPDPLGVAGPYVGVHNGAVIVAGGANFPVAEGEDLWEVPKRWQADAYVLTGLAQGNPQWVGGLSLDRPAGYGAVVSTRHGVLCIGGDDEELVFAEVFLLTWDGEGLVQTPLPDLPQPCAYGAAALIGETVYLAGGMSGRGLDSAMNNFWSLDLSRMGSNDGSFRWRDLPSWPGPERAFNLTVAQHNGFEMCIYVLSGRRQTPGVPGSEGIEPLRDVYEYTPSTGQWRRRADLPVPVMAGTGIAVGQSHLFVLSGDDAKHSAKFWQHAATATSAELDTMHPGFLNRAWAYHTITDTWIDAGETPVNQVTTPAVRFGNEILLISGEIRPRVRTVDSWRIRVQSQWDRGFKSADFMVMAFYFMVLIGVGVWFARKNRSTNDFFRGGQSIPWWVAGCSIFATMLSSIAYVAIPAKTYAQDWLLMLQSLMIPVVAPLAVYLALPFFRRIDATSAYEYLEKRFNRGVRLLGSTLFTIFHVFRMGIVLSLAGLALATFTPLSPVHSVLIMGVLCVLYSTMGGIKAVVWADTIQTFVLIAGVFLIFLLIFMKTEGGLATVFHVAQADGKMHFANWDFSAASITTLAIWVVVLGGLGQNMASYMADQCVVQRYVSTPTKKLAARAIWTNAIMCIPSTFLFFAMGTALYVFFKGHPELLDPTMNTDQILPLFISTQVPAGIAGLVAAGIFAAAQSTISTSMNSTATTVVTDFFRTFNLCQSEDGYFRAGRVLTFCLGGCGTLLGLMFVHPGITSLFDEFLTGIGFFMGVLAGVFLLGMLTKRAHATGALVGAAAAFAVLLSVHVTAVAHWLLYAPIGIAMTLCIGYLISLVIPGRRRDCAGLTIHTVLLGSRS